MGEGRKDLVKDAWRVYTSQMDVSRKWVLSVGSTEGESIGWILLQHLPLLLIELSALPLVI